MEKQQSNKFTFGLGELERRMGAATSEHYRDTM